MGLRTGQRNSPDAKDEGAAFLHFEYLNEIICDRDRGGSRDSARDILHVWFIIGIYNSSSWKLGCIHGQTDCKFPSSLDLIDFQDLYGQSLH